MTVKTYIKINDKAKEIKGFFVKKNGKVVRIKEIYAGIGGGKQLIYKEDEGPFEKLEIITAKDILDEGVKLPRGTFGEEYNAKIQATGGTGIYKFCFVDPFKGTILETRVWLKGLTLYPDGSIRGVPEDGGVISRTIRVVDSSGAWRNKSIRLRVGSKKVSFTIKKNYVFYNGQPQKPVIIPDDDAITADDYIVTIGDNYHKEETQTDVGNYFIDVKVTKKGYAFGGFSNQGTLRSFTIRRNESSKMFLYSQTVKYDGKPHGLSPLVEPAEIQSDYKVTYVGKNGTVYEETEQPPTEVGTYTVNAETTNKNYVVRKATATLTISK